MKKIRLEKDGRMNLIASESFIHAVPGYDDKGAHPSVVPLQ